MIIANPIYDATFKFLLEHNRAAKFLIGTILDCKVLTLEQTPTEHAHKNRDSGQVDLYRKDFAATIETKDEGTKRVIIEMQKAKTLGDISRFRKYLSFEYARSELPIIAIYILGFNLSVDSAAFTAYPEFRDLKTNKPLNVKDDFVDRLTHKAYFVQTPHIKPSINTKLDMILSVFEQAHFVSDKKTMKTYPFETDDPEFKELLTVLSYAAADETVLKELEEELYYQDFLEEVFGKVTRELKQKDELVAQQAEALAQKDELVAQQAEALAQKDEENRKHIEEIEALKKQMEAMKK